MPQRNDGTWVSFCECEYCQADEHPRFDYLKMALEFACIDLMNLINNHGYNVTSRELIDKYIMRASVSTE